MKVSERAVRWIKGIIAAVIFIVSIVLVIVGQRSTGIPGTIQMLIGLAGILILLFIYNRQYQ